jgi:hypothetical protein
MTYHSQDRRHGLCCRPPRPSPVPSAPPPRHSVSARAPKMLMFSSRTMPAINQPGKSGLLAPRLKQTRFFCQFTLQTARRVGGAVRRRGIRCRIAKSRSTVTLPENHRSLIKLVDLAARWGHGWTRNATVLKLSLPNQINALGRFGVTEVLSATAPVGVGRLCYSEYGRFPSWEVERWSARLARRLG